MGNHFWDEVMEASGFVIDSIAHPVNPLHELSTLHGHAAPGSHHIMPVDGLPRGDGTGVIIVSGVLEPVSMVHPLQISLVELGYPTVIEGWSRNSGPTDGMIGKIEEELYEMCVTTGRKAILFGHSKGGRDSREVAERNSDLVLHEFLVASPANGSRFAMSIPMLLTEGAILIARSIISRSDALGEELQHQHLLRRPPSVPTTCIVAEHDGAVAPGAQVLDGAKIIRTDDNHGGILLRPEVLAIVANELAAIVRTEHALPREFIESDARMVRAAAKVRA